MSKSAALQEFEERVAKLRTEKGLVDLKFYAGEVSESSTETFCREANDLLRAVENARTESLEFGDSKRA